MKGLQRSRHFFSTILLLRGWNTAAAMSSSATSKTTTSPTGLTQKLAPDPPESMKPVYDDNDILIKSAGRMTYCSKDTKIGIVRRDTAGMDTTPDGVTWQDHDVWVHSGRKKEQLFLTLHKNGFELIEKDEVSRDIDYLDKDDVIDKYYPHCEELLAKYLSSKEGGRKRVSVKAFDHNVRLQKSDGKNQTPLGVVHGDYTTISGPRRLELLAQAPKVNDVLRERLGDQPLLESDAVKECIEKRRRFALINVWRNIDKDNAVQSYPLACIDANTHCKSDLRTLQIHYADRIGENFLACPSERHTWYYFPQMTYDEALLIKQWDSDGDLANDKETDCDLCTFSIHSAFQDPITPEDAPPRKSIEVRCVAIWDN